MKKIRKLIDTSWLSDLMRQVRQHASLVADDVSGNKTLQDLMDLYGLSVQELRDASFGPLTTGWSDIELIVQSIEDFSRGGALLYRSKKYVELLEVMRRSYAYFPRNYLDVLSSLHDYEDLLEQSKGTV